MHLMDGTMAALMRAEEYYQHRIDHLIGCCPCPELDQDLAVCVDILEEIGDIYHEHHHMMKHHKLGHAHDKWGHEKPAEQEAKQMVEAAVKPRATSHNPY